MQHFQDYWWVYSGLGGAAFYIRYLMGRQPENRSLGEKMRWSGPGKTTPVCEQAFVLTQEKPGTVYVDGRGTKFLAGVKGSIPTYLLQLRSSTCGRAGEDTRIRYPLVYDTQHIEVIAYVNGKPVSARRFHRKK